MNKIAKTGFAVSLGLGLAFGGAVSAQAADNGDGTYEATWFMPGSSGEVTWPQRALEPGDNGFCQVDTYRYDTDENKAKVDALIATRVLNGANEDSGIGLYLSHQFVQCGLGTVEPPIEDTPGDTTPDEPIPGEEPAPTPAPEPAPVVVPVQPAEPVVPAVVAAPAPTAAPVLASTGPSDVVIGLIPWASALIGLGGLALWGRRKFA